jgi:DNA-binding winged helix-turn-helix (wHTH) protein/tetratricopeptide (TPR) repeat protein
LGRGESRRFPRLGPSAPQGVAVNKAFLLRGRYTGLPARGQPGGSWSIRVSFHPYELDLQSGELWKDGAPVRLQPQPGKVLCLLVDRAGNLVTREEIQKVLWQGETFVDFDQGLNYCIRQIRVALEDSTENPAYVETVPRRGYRFKAAVTMVPIKSAGAGERLAVPAAVAPAAGQPVPDILSVLPGREAPLPARAPVPWSRAAAALRHPVALSVVGLIIVAVALYFVFLRRPRVEASGAVGHASVPGNYSIQARPSVAVLGFANLDGRSEDAWLATALSEMLSTELAAGGKLRLVSGEEVSHAHPGPVLSDSLSHDSLERLRHELGADVIVTGSYAVLNDGSNRKLRLDLRLQDTQRGDTLLALAETGNAAHLFDLVTDSGVKLRDKLGIGAISPSDQPAVQESLPSGETAQRLYAEGLQKLRVLDALSARDLLTQAEAEQPNFAPVHSALADAWALLGYDNRAADEAKKALDLASGLPREEHLSIEARYYDLTKNWAKAEEALQALVSFFPDSVDYGLRFASLEIKANKPDKAVAEIARLRRVPGPQGESPRIDLLESHLRAGLGDFKQERDLADQAMRKARQVDLPLLTAQALQLKAHALERLGDLDGSLQASDESRRLYIQANDQRGAAVAMLVRADVLYDKGDFAGARQQDENAISIFTEIGNLRGVRDASERIGNSYFDQGKLAEAREYYSQALEKDRIIQSLSGIASDNGNLANVLEGLGDLKGALKLNQEALSAFQATSQKRGAASTICNIGVLQWGLGNLDAAARSFQQASALHQEIGYQRGQGYAATGLGDVYVSRNDLEQARQAYQQALSLFQKTGQNDLVAQTNVSLAVVAYYQQHFAQAEQLARSSLDEFEKDKDAENSAWASAWLARALLAEGRNLEASAVAEHGQAYSSQITSHIPKFEASLALARADAATGRKADAEKLIRQVLDSANREGYQQFSLEARLTLIELDSSGSQRKLLAALGAEAGQKGYNLIAAQARSLASQTSKTHP